ncbi:MAG: hypothetical protein EA350_11055 [Gemmatimonadales bacterium]|nr:MAG: hypothetical protein EA350_11055 [Gemmatimonadales bacterium]
MRPRARPLRRGTSFPGLALLLPALLAGGLLLPACSTSSGARGDRDVITEEEIRRSSATDAYRLVSSLRPAWLRERGAVTLRTTDSGDGQALVNPQIVVYIDGTRLGDVSELETVATTGLTSIRRLSASEATQRFGTGHPRGALLLSRTP